MKFSRKDVTYDSIKSQKTRLYLLSRKHYFAKTTGGSN